MKVKLPLLSDSCNSYTEDANVFVIGDKIVFELSAPDRKFSFNTSDLQRTIKFLEEVKWKPLKQLHT